MYPRRYSSLLSSSSPRIPPSPRRPDFRDFRSPPSVSRFTFHPPSPLSTMQTPCRFFYPEGGWGNCARIDPTISRMKLFRPGRNSNPGQLFPREEFNFVRAPLRRTAKRSQRSILSALYRRDEMKFFAADVAADNITAPAVYFASTHLYVFII